MAKQAPDTIEARPIEVNALGITYQIELEGGRTIAFEERVPSDIGMADLDDALDTIHDAAERLQARVNLPKAKGKLKIAHNQLYLQERMYKQTEAEHLTRWGAGRKQGTFHPTEAQRAALDNIMRTIAQFRSDIPIIEYEIARLQAVIDRREAPEAPPMLAEAAE
jgi:hypothetical protein